MSRAFIKNTAGIVLKGWCCLPWGSKTVGCYQVCWGFHLSLTGIFMTYSSICYGQGWFHGCVTCTVTDGPMLRRVWCFVWCFSVAILKFPVNFEQGLCTFILHRWFKLCNWCWLWKLISSSFAMCYGLKHGFHGTKLWTRLEERAAVSQGSFWPTPLISTGG